MGDSDMEFDLKGALKTVNRLIGIAFVCMISILAAALVASAAKADIYTGNELLDFCKNDHPFTQGTCFGLIAGYFEGMQFQFKCSKKDPHVTRGQTKDIVVAFLNEHPSDRHLPAYYLASRAFIRAFDCKYTGKLS